MPHLIAENILEIQYVITSSIDEIPLQILEKISFAHKKDGFRYDYNWI